MTAIVDHQLERRFRFEGDLCFEFYTAVNEAERPVVDELIEKGDVKAGRR